MLSLAVTTLATGITFEAALDPPCLFAFIVGHFKNIYPIVLSSSHWKKKTTKTVRTVPIIQRENVQRMYSVRSEKWSHRSRRPCSTVRAFLTVTVVVLPPCVDTARQCPIVCYKTNLHNQLHRAMLLFRYIYCELLKGRPLTCTHAC